MLDGRLAPDKALAAERHLDDCGACREAFAQASAQDEALDRALAHDPGEAYFESFADRVEAKIEAGGARPAMGPSFLDGLRDWFAVPRNLATAGAAFAVVIGVVTTLLVAQMTNQNVMRNDRLVERMEERGGAAAPPPTAQNAPRETETEMKQKELDAKAEPGATLGLSEEAARQAREFRREAASGAAPQIAAQRAAQVTKNALGDDERVRAAAPAPAPMASEVQSGSSTTPTDNVKAALRAQPMSKMTTRDFAYDAANARLCGEVRDPSGRPLRFASVSLLGRNTGDQTDEHGRFCLPAAPGRDSLLVQLVGFEPLRTGVSLTSAPNHEIRLTMDPIRALASSSRSAAEVQVGSRALAQKSAGAVARPTAEMTLSALPDSLRGYAELAQRLSSVAARSKDAKQHEAAAEQWERLLVGVVGTPLEVQTRGRIAEQRYQAWEAAPDLKRAQAAREALTAYLVRAPIGPERNRATLWLDNVAK